MKTDPSMLSCLTAWVIRPYGVDPVEDMHYTDEQLGQQLVMLFVLSIKPGFTTPARCTSTWPSQLAVLQEDKGEAVRTQLHVHVCRSRNLPSLSARRRRHKNWKFSEDSTGSHEDMLFFVSSQFA